MAGSSTVETSYSCRIGLVAASRYRFHICTQCLPLPQKATAGEVCSEQFLKTKAIKPVKEVG